MATILLAEDDEAMLNFLVMALVRAGHEVISKRDGLEALQEIEQRKDINLLLTDIVMPGIDGIELAQKAVDTRPDIKVMFITGFAAMAMQSIDKTEEKEKQPQLLSKPFHLNDLVKQVEEILAA
ncbi:MAG: response regulator [Alphaproteobacteria bacterium]